MATIHTLDTDLIIARVPALPPLESAKVHELLSAPGPCITVLLPPYRPGAQEKSAEVQLRAFLQEAQQQLSQRGASLGQIGDLLDPLHLLAEDPQLLKGDSYGRIIFRAPTMFEQFQTTETSRALLAIGSCFHVRPILAEAAMPRLFYLLALTKRSVKLWSVTDRSAEPIALPGGVPETLSAFLDLEPPDHDLENRSTASGIQGGARVRFGTGSGRETAHAHLADYYKAVDRAVNGLAEPGTMPLVLAGAGEDCAIYRSASAATQLLTPAINGNPEMLMQNPETLQQARAIVRSDLVARAGAAVREWKERLSPERFCSDPVTATRRAFAGRVSHLYVREDTSWCDLFEQPGYPSWGQEDMLNLAIVQTLRHHGKAFLMPDDLMPAETTIAAILRF